jgi:hypothetical protein
MIVTFSERRAIADDASTPGALLRLTCAATMASAGVVHLVMAPDHSRAWFAEGLGFAVAGAVQLGIAVAMVARCRPLTVGAATAVNVTLIVLWAVSRTVGFPVGPHASVAEGVSLIDAYVVVAEAVALGCALLAFVLGVTSGPSWSRRAGANLAMCTAAMAVTSSLVVSPAVRGHAHDSSSGASTASSAAHTDGHAHGASPPVAMSQVSPGAVAGNSTTDDRGFSLLMNGHHDDAEPQPLDPATTVQLADQLARTSELVASYPTVADAEAGGYRRQGPYSPGLGTHYGKGADTLVGAAINDETVLDPMLIYSGNESSDQLVGFMYVAFGVEGEPQGFAGPNDIWHYHTNVCLVAKADGSTDTPFGADRDNVPKELCDGYGGVLIENTGYMLHVWTVPGWENPLGVFHDTHPGLTCSDGSYYTKPMEEVGWSANICVGEP